MARLSSVVCVDGSRTVFRNEKDIVRLRLLGGHLHPRRADWHSRHGQSFHIRQCRENDLTHMHHFAILMHMRTTLILDDELLEKARKLTGLKEKTRILHAGLEALISRESARRLAALGGTERRLKPIPRRRGRPAR